MCETPTRNGYQKGCRCTGCSQAQRDYAQAYASTKEAKRQGRLDVVSRYKMFCGCAKCGYAEHPMALDLHHVEPKSFTVAQGLMRRWVTVRAEIRKCIVLCANCHRIEHSDM